MLLQWRHTGSSAAAYRMPLPFLLPAPMPKHLSRLQTRRSACEQPLPTTSRCAEGLPGRAARAALLIPRRTTLLFPPALHLTKPPACLCALQGDEHALDKFPGGSEPGTRR